MNVPIDPNATMPKQVKIFAVLHLIFAPIIYLIVANMVHLPQREGGEYDMLLYILLIVAVVSPTVMPIVSRAQIAHFRSTPDSAMTSDQLYTASNIVSFAFTNFAYIMGLVVFFLSAKITRLYYFYPIGIFWSVVYWPTDAKYRKFLTKVQGNEPIVT